MLLNLYNKYGKYLITYFCLGGKWMKLANSLKSRNSKQIRERYLNVIRPEIKKLAFSEEEDLKVMELYTKYGSRWSLIS